MKVVNLFITASLLLNILVWAAVIPIWHFPDEQSHFGQVVFLAETGRNPQGNELDLTEEIYISEVLLGTDRDNSGNNKFTFHPEYRIEYTDSLIGLQEASIAALAKTNAKKTFVKQEASRYPPVYYLPASFIYKLFYPQDLFTRVFSVRAWSMILFIINLYIIYRIGTILFPKDNLVAQAATILVGFQPMMVFSNVGVNSDALGNLLFSAFLLTCLRIITCGLSRKFLFSLIIIMVLAVYTKPQFIVIFPSAAALFLFIFLRDVSIKHKYSLSVLFILLLLILLYVLYILRIGSFVIIDRILVNFDMPSLMKFSLEYTVPHTIREVLPWYFGIYDWLGVTYSRTIHRIINRVVLVGILGFGYWLIKMIREKRWKEVNFQNVIYLIGVNFLFFLAVSIYDWLSWYTSSYQLGVQGRYFFPVISIHMFILIIGWQSIFPLKLRRYVLNLLVALIIILNFIGLYTVSKTYYDIYPLATFIKQVSQYKPWFFKGGWFISLSIAYILSVFFLVIKFLTKEFEKKSSKIKS